MIVSNHAGNYNWKDEAQGEGNIEIFYAIESGFPSQEEWRAFLIVAEEFFMDEIFIGVEESINVENVPYLTFRIFCSDWKSMP